MGFPKRMRRVMFARSSKRCERCGRKWDDGFMLEFHHILPISGGGTNIPENAELLCRECHMYKHYILFKKADTKRERNANAYAVRKIKERIAKKSLYRYGKEPR